MTKKRTTVELSEELQSLVKEYQTDRGMTFIGIVEKAIKSLLETEGYIEESFMSRIRKISTEAKKTGIKQSKIESEIERAILYLMEQEVFSE